MIAISGSSGFVGRALRRSLGQNDVPVRRLVRRPPTRPDEARWDPSVGTLDPATLAGAQAVIHLGGESLTSGPWTAARRKRLRTSRVDTTQLLAETLAAMPDPPPVLITASAIGFYGHRGDEVLTEDSARGNGFLAELAEEWEGATAPARAAGIRVVQLRLGVILGREGGYLKAVLPVFRLGLGGPLGRGEQWVSWIAIDDVVAAIRLALTDAGLEGPVNLTAPHPVRNSELTRELAAALRRPAFFRVPAFLLELILGDLAREAMLASTRVLPARLEARGFRFAHPELGPSLPTLLDRA